MLAFEDIFSHPFPKVLQDAGSADLHILKSRSNAVVINQDLGHKKVKIWLSPLLKANLAKASLLFITVVSLDFFL